MKFYTDKFTAHHAIVTILRLGKLDSCHYIIPSASAVCLQLLVFYRGVLKLKIATFANLC